MEHPMLSVLMPVYNAEAYLRESIESILNQTFTDFELLIGIDGSPDHSLEIASSCKDSRIRIFNSPVNRGISRTCNLLLEESRGKWITRQDSDDLSLPERFQKQISFLERNPGISVCGTNYTTFGDRNQRMFMPLKDEEIRAYMILNNPFCTSTVMFRRPDPAIRFREELAVSEDYDLWFELSKTCKMANLPDHLLLYRWHSANISLTRQRAMVETANAIRSNILNYALSCKIEEHETRVLNLAEGAGLESHEDLLILERFLLRLIRSNKEISYYSQRAIEPLFSKFWIASCLKTKNLTRNEKLRSCLSSDLANFNNLVRLLSLQNFRSLLGNLHG